MQSIPLPLIGKLGELQTQVWSSLSEKIEGIQFTDPLTVANRVSDVRQEFSNPRVVATFGLQGLEGGPHRIALDPDLALAIYNSEQVDGEEADIFDEAFIATIQPRLEAIISALGSAVGAASGKAVQVAGLQFSLAAVSLPPDVEPEAELLRTNVTMSGERYSGSLVWLIDGPTAYSMTGDDPGRLQPGATQPTVRDDDHYADENLDMLLDIPLEVSVELGRVKMFVRDVLDLGSGSIVEIEKSAGEPVDVRLNGNLVARGEVVVIEDNFGVRITEILKPNERLESIEEAA